MEKIKLLEQSLNEITFALGLFRSQGVLTGDTTTILGKIVDRAKNNVPNKKDLLLELSKDLQSGFEMSNVTAQQIPIKTGVVEINGERLLVTIKKI
jgi:hypothetical protein